ncbi:MAG: hypothetical protein EBQ76_02880 [Betaproteobacteria bacterium]|nr:hypothetical protein [Betaproteobacteria bacterium]NBY13693.1 hypothetical protein [Betaproteobacteria bacterium]NDF04487.1 hypothetical protein [Betaproteobacteria bacterium]
MQVELINQATQGFTLAHGCLLAMAILPIVCAGIAKAGMKSYDNANPRDWLSAQEGYRRRAVAAQANSWEAFAFFTAALLVAHWSGAAPARIDVLAAAVVVSRLAYIACYLANLATLRSLVWTVGWGCTLAIFLAAL